MVKERMETALRRQLNRELYSAYLYLSMSAYFESVNLKGLANWMQVQTQEELLHAMKFYNYLVSRGGRVIMEAIEAPPSEWKSPLEAFEHVCEHEQKVSALIHELVKCAVALKDHATNSFLQWFVTEQVEEEASADEVRQKLRLIGEDADGLLLLDGKLGQRVFTPPAAAGARGD